METDEDGESVEQVVKQRMENKGGNSWSKEESQYLLRLYTKKSNDVGPDHTYRSKLHLWNDIAKRLNKTYQMQRTTVQCIGHHKSLQRKNFNGNLNQAAKQSNVSSFELTSEEDGEINVNESGGSMDSQSSSTIAEVIRSTLLEIHELKEEAKERRHRERMALLEKYLQQSSANVKSTAPQPHVYGEEKVMKPAVLALQQQQQQPPQQQQQKKPSDEFLAMRTRLLEMQRKKMEDRERKHRGSLVGAAKTARLIVRDLK